MDIMGITNTTGLSCVLPWVFPVTAMVLNSDQQKSPNSKSDNMFHVIKCVIVMLLYELTPSYIMYTTLNNVKTWILQQLTHDESMLQLR